MKADPIEPKYRVSFNFFQPTVPGRYPLCDTVRFDTLKNLCCSTVRLSSFNGKKNHSWFWRALLAQTMKKSQKLSKKAKMVSSCRHLTEKDSFLILTWPSTKPWEKSQKLSRMAKTVSKINHQEIGFLKKSHIWRLVTFSGLKNSVLLPLLASKILRLLGFRYLYDLSSSF